ncbi:MAG: hypothetical protein ACRD3H_06660, partial [Terriglobales bacterium]
MSAENIKTVVEERYGAAARRVTAGTRPATDASECCGSGPSAVPCCDPISSNLYTASEVAGLPKDAVAASLGCGNPTALAQLNAGETVLDLGS